MGRDGGVVPWGCMSVEDVKKQGTVHIHLITSILEEVDHMERNKSKFLKKNF